MNDITTVKEFNSHTSIKEEMRSVFRNAAIGMLSLKRDISKTNNWVQFPYYHHVFDDEKKGFEKQLNYLKNFGDFISMDQAHELIGGDIPLNGRFFCVSFDDGFTSTYSNMLEITSDLDIPVIIYLPTDYIGLSVDSTEDIEKIKQFHPEDPKIVSFLSWSDCREMLKNKLTFGSHTLGHVNLSKIGPTEIEIELKESKAKIESELMVPCNHFACPWGRIGIDFDPLITTALSKKIGYKSFATTTRGKMRKGDDLYQLKRQHLMANWGVNQLKYFFGT
jgi:peptidoglycan/xylan/chitin deacetylase (PgdA/CDA1 family)